MNRSSVAFRDEKYDGQFARTLAASYAGMCDLGEAFAVAAEIGRRPNPDAWHDAWKSRADSVARLAHDATTVAAQGSAWLRASEYYRQAYFFLRHDITDDRLLDAYGKHVEAFQAAVPLLPITTHRVDIPFDGIRLKGYLFAPDSSGERRATLLFPCGYDSTAEEGFAYVATAIANGYNALCCPGHQVPHVDHRVRRRLRRR